MSNTQAADKAAQQSADKARIDPYDVGIASKGALFDPAGENPTKSAEDLEHDNFLMSVSLLRERQLQPMLVCKAHKADDGNDLSTAKYTVFVGRKRTKAGRRIRDWQRELSQIPTEHAKGVWALERDLQVSDVAKIESWPGLWYSLEPRPLSALAAILAENSQRKTMSFDQKASLAEKAFREYLANPAVTPSIARQMTADVLKVTVKQLKAYINYSEAPDEAKKLVQAGAVTGEKVANAVRSGDPENDWRRSSKRAKPSWRLRKKPKAKARDPAKRPDARPGCCQSNAAPAGRSLQQWRRASHRVARLRGGLGVVDDPHQGIPWGRSRVARPLPRRGGQAGLQGRAQEAGSQDQEAGSQDQEAGSQGQEAGSQGQEAGSQDPEVVFQPGCHKAAGVFVPQTKDPPMLEFPSPDGLIEDWYRSAARNPDGGNRMTYIACILIGWLAGRAVGLGARRSMRDVAVFCEARPKARCPLCQAKGQHTSRCPIPFYL